MRSTGRPLRVVVAEDSLTVRALLVRILSADPDITVVGEARTGVEAVQLTARLRPDLVTMDVHMPVMAGLDATRSIMAECPTPILVVSSSASRAEPSLPFDALRAGALMVLAKPDRPGAPEHRERARQLCTMVKALADVRVVRQHRRPTPEDPLPWKAAVARRLPAARIRVVGVAASTGGPVALQRLLDGLPEDFTTPMLIVQHISPGFVDGLALWLSETTGRRVVVASHGDVPQAGRIYLAPDDSHLELRPTGSLALTDHPPRGGLRPSADTLFESLARAAGPATVGVVLTGMGTDGLEGSRQLRASGAWLIAQDETTCTVYGMPRAVAEAGLSDAVLPLEDIPAALAALTAGATS